MWRSCEKDYKIVRALRLHVRALNSNVMLRSMFMVIAMMMIFVVKSSNIQGCIKNAETGPMD